MAYFQKIVMFGDGAKGAATHVYSIWWGVDTAEIPTGITKTWSRKDRNDLGTLVFTNDEREGSAKELIDEWADKNGKEPF